MSTGAFDRFWVYRIAMYSLFSHTNTHQCAFLAAFNQDSLEDTEAPSLVTSILTNAPNLKPTEQLGCQEDGMFRCPSRLFQADIRHHVIPCTVVILSRFKWLTTPI